MKNIILANKELNEWCGTDGINYYEGIGALGFLFKYAVPVAVKKCGLVIFRTELLGSIYDAIYDDEDPALALFWALWQVKEKGNE